MTIDALVEIVWMDMEAAEGSGEYRSGVKFVDISEEAMSKLRAFLAGPFALASLFPAPREQAPKERIGEKMDQKAFQDYYPDHLSHCYGCGRLNQYGLQIRSYWDGEESVAVFHPKPFHTAIPGYVYGGLIASMIDCHGTGTASAAAYRAEGRGMEYGTGLAFLDRLTPCRISSSHSPRCASGSEGSRERDQRSKGHCFSDSFCNG